MNELFTTIQLELFRDYLDLINIVKQVKINYYTEVGLNNMLQGLYVIPYFNKRITIINNNPLNTWKIRYKLGNKYYVQKLF